MKPEIRKSAEISSTAARACSMALSISPRQPSPAAIFRSSQTSNAPSSSRTFNWRTSLSFQASSWWL
jgi:hypothetical protein